MQEETTDYKKNLAELDEALDKKRRRVKIHHALFGSLFLIVVILLVIYFCLPTFKVSSMTISGLVNLSRDQYFELADISSSDSLLFFDAESAYENAEDKASCLFLNGKGYSNPFVAQTEVFENRPLFEYEDDNGNRQIYFIDGHTFSELESDIAELGSSYSALYSQLTNENDFPEAHLPSNVSISSERYVQAMTINSLQYIDYAYVQRPNDATESDHYFLEYVQFLTGRSSTNQELYSADLFFDYGADSLIRFSSVVIDDFEDIFSLDISTILDQARSEIDSDESEAASYTFLDDQTTISCYSFSISLTDSTLRITAD